MESQLVNFLKKKKIMNYREISYNLPTNYYLFMKNDDPSSFVLKQDFGFPFENILAEKYTIKVILPEGSTNATVSLFLPIY